MRLLTWNASNLGRGSRELALSRLLDANKVDIAVVTETELPGDAAAIFAINGYATFLPLLGTGEKARVLVFAKLSVAVKIRQDLMAPGVPTVWVELARQRQPNLIIGGAYRQWTSSAQSGALKFGRKFERDQLEVIVAQMRAAAAESRAVVVLGDFNLDTLRAHDDGYNGLPLLSRLLDESSAAGLVRVSTPPTWESHGCFVGADGVSRHRSSCIDHVYSVGVAVTVSVLTDRTTDHRPVLAVVEGREAAAALEPIERRNFKKIRRQGLEDALNLWPWQTIYAMEDVEATTKFVVDGITSALDMVAPVRAIKVRKSDRGDLYLSTDTLDMMRKRDAAAPGGHYRRLRNRVTSLVKRDRLRTNLATLRERRGDPKAMWDLAKTSMGQGRRALPADLKVKGVRTTSAAGTAAAVNEEFVDKILRIRADLAIPSLRSLAWSARPLPVTPPGPPAPQEEKARFSFSFANAKKIAKVIRGLKSTGAVGLDGIPVSVLKLGSDVLAGPISHLVNRSLTSGVVPRGFKIARVVPVYKGKGKQTSDPASYRPVSILPAMSKILECVVKEAIESHLAKVNGLPNSQFGFRPKRSTTAAVATAHAQWTKAQQEGNYVGVLLFDFSSAFDTVDKCQLLPKLEALGIRGTALAWFEDYLSGGRQCVDWSGTLSEFRDVIFGVRQGSILGPLIFLILMSDLPHHLHRGDVSGRHGDVGYADDVSIWVVAKDPRDIKPLLEAKAESIASFARQNGLKLNAGKTQLMVVCPRSKGKIHALSVCVEGTSVHAAKEVELLGVKIAADLSMSAQTKAVAAAAKQRAGMVQRLTHYVPRGPYLKQLALGLVLGKVAYAAAAVAGPRSDSSATPSMGEKATQVALNDVARSLTGSKRRDHVRVGELLEKAEIPSYNALAVKSLALETWNAFRSADGPCGGHNPLGSIMFGAVEESTAELRPTTRSCTAAVIPRPLPLAADTMAAHGVELWNANPELRAAATSRAAKKVATRLGRAAPI